jgi:hypothetical protein
MAQYTGDNNGVEDVFYGRCGGYVTGFWPSLCQIAINVEAYRTQSALTQCHNCQQFGNVWANCKQPPGCLWCGGDHLHKECPEENAASTPTYCNCKLLEEEKPHPANYQGCRHAREELQKRKSQKTPRTTTGRVFSSNTITPGVSFAAALRGSSAQTEQPREMQLPMATPQTEGVRTHLLDVNKCQVSQSGLHL